MKIEIKLEEALVGDKLFSVKYIKKTGKNKSNDCGEIYNLDFNENENYSNAKMKSKQGPGVYAITYNDHIIYIGKYRTNRDDFSNNVITIRWAKHIMTFTNRGYRLGGTIFKKLKDPSNIKNSRKQLQYKECRKEIDEKTRKELMKHLKENGAWRLKDTGTVTSLNRLNFALKNWDQFMKLSEDKRDALAKFKFYFFRIKTNESDKKKDISPFLADYIENRLLQKFNPECNTIAHQVSESKVREGNNIEKVKDYIDEIVEEIKKIS